MISNPTERRCPRQVCAEKEGQTGWWIWYGYRRPGHQRGTDSRDRQPQAFWSPALSCFLQIYRLCMDNENIQSVASWQVYFLHIFLRFIWKFIKLFVSLQREGMGLATVRCRTARETHDGLSLFMENLAWTNPYLHEVMIQIISVS